MRAVNLLPRDEVVKSFEAKRGVVFGGVFGAALVTAAIVSMTISAGGAVADKQAELDGLRAEIAAIPAPVVKDHSTDDVLAAEQGCARRGALCSAYHPHRLGPRAAPSLARPPRGRLADEPVGDGAQGRSPLGRCGRLHLGRDTWPAPPTPRTALRDSFRGSP